MRRALPELAEEPSRTERVRETDSLHGNRAQETQLLELFAEDSQLNVYAGELKVRPPGAPTTNGDLEDEACPRRTLSVRERSRQPEPCEHAVVEAGHGANPVAGEGGDE